MIVLTPTKKESRSFEDKLRTKSKPWTLWAGAFIGLLVWEFAAQTFGKSTAQSAQVMPSLVTVVTEGWAGLSNFYKGGLLLEATANSGQTSFMGGLLALVSNGAVTLFRVGVGLVTGVVLGTVLGLLVSGIRAVRFSATGVAELMRMLPTLAMAPLFTLWFGATTTACIIFIIFSVAFIMFVGATNAVRNIPPEVIEYPRTLGVNRVRLSLRVLVPAILPEVRGPLMFAGLVAWTTALAAELYGITDGLGWMLGQTLRFSLVDQMVIVAVAFSALALLTMSGLSRLMDRSTVWKD